MGAVQSTINYAYENSNWKDKLTSYDGNAITYDAIGNPLSYDGATYTWTAGRQLASYSKGTLNVSYKYNEDGLRTQKLVNDNGTTTTYDYLWVDGILKEVMAGSNRIRLIYDGEEATGFVLNNTTTYFYEKNIQGDIVAICDEIGNRYTNYTYDAWGNIINITGGQQFLQKMNPATYRGYYLDQETGMYYLQSRYYKADWGRFLNADDQYGTLSILEFNKLDSNIYAYCKSNPVMGYDPSGMATNQDTDIMYPFMNGILNGIFYPIIFSRGSINMNLVRDGLLESVIRYVKAGLYDGPTVENGFASFRYIIYPELGLWFISILDYNKYAFEFIGENEKKLWEFASAIDDIVKEAYTALAGATLIGIVLIGTGVGAIAGTIGSGAAWGLLGGMYALESGLAGLVMEIAFDSVKLAERLFYSIIGSDA